MLARHVVLILFMSTFTRSHRARTFELRERVSTQDCLERDWPSIGMCSPATLCSFYLCRHSLARIVPARSNFGNAASEVRNPVFSSMLLKDTETPKDWRNPCHFHCYSPSRRYSVRTLHHLLFRRLRRFDPPFRVLLSRSHPSYRRHCC